MTRRVVLALTLTAGLLTAAGLAWWIWGGGPAKSPEPPEPALDGADPELAAAVNAARARVLREPRSASAWGAYGEVLLANDFFATADACLARAEELDPREPRWTYLRAWGLLPRDRDAGLAALRRTVELCDRVGEDNTTPWLLLAEVYMERDDRDQVEALCGRVLERQPDNPRAHCDLGMIALTHNDLENSIPHLLRAAESPFTRRHACTQLAAAYQRRGDEAAAAEYTRRAQEAPPDLSWSDPFLAEMGELTVGRQSRFRQAQQLEQQGRFQEEAALLRKIKEDYQDDRSYVALGIVLVKMGELAEAEQDLRAAADLAPRAADAPYYLAVVLYQQGERLRLAGDGSAAAAKYREAADAARRATELKPDHALAHFHLGLSLERLGRRPEAIEALRTAVRCRPEMADLHLELGKALADDGQEAEAAVHLRNASDLRP